MILKLYGNDLYFNVYILDFYFRKLAANVVWSSLDHSMKIPNFISPQILVGFVRFAVKAESYGRCQALGFFVLCQSMYFIYLL